MKICYVETFRYGIHFFKKVNDRKELQISDLQTAFYALFLGNFISVEALSPLAKQHFNVACNQRKCPMLHNVAKNISNVKKKHPKYVNLGNDFDIGSINRILISMFWVFLVLWVFFSKIICLHLKYANFLNFILFNDCHIFFLLLLILLFDYVTIVAV
ncbi:hypothetical protein Avbf_08698 [Armadillidium vulgare]|nr:hypothetical protein Avbf_08698 [Armadillidium vulgare]